MSLKYDTELGLAVDGIISNSRHYTRTELENMDSSTVFTIADELGVLYRTGPGDTGEPDDPNHLNIITP